MSNIISSASKIVFILMAAAVCLAFLFEVAAGRVSFDPKDFMILASMAFAFYFSKPASPATPDSTTVASATPAPDGK